MITIAKTENIKVLSAKTNERLVVAELRGLSTDTKPENIGDIIIDNGSIFIEINTGKIYLYDLQNKQWNEV